MLTLRRRLINLCLLSASSAFCLLAVDYFLRIIGVPSQNGRVMLLAGGNLFTNKYGIRQYSPSTQLRHSAVYGNTLEYSYLFETDPNGFRLTNTCNKESSLSPAVIFVGDSYTEGQGSESPWTSSLQKILCSRGFYSINASIAGYGVLEMEKVVSYMLNKGLDVKHVYLAIIPDDLYRKPVSIVSSPQCSMYVLGSRANCGEYPTWWHHPMELNGDQLVKEAKKRYNYGLLPLLHISSSLLRARLGQPSIQKTPAHEGIYVPPEILTESIRAVNRIAFSLGPEKFSLFILPSKQHLKDSNSTRAIQKKADISHFLSALNPSLEIYDLRGCSLQPEHFFENDPHLNQKGHHKLAECAIDALGT